MNSSKSHSPLQRNVVDNSKIAVIGLGCTYPGAMNPLQFWENVLARRQQFREMPDVRLPNDEYFNADPEFPDKTYQNRAAVIENFEFDWIKNKIPKQTYESTDIVHWMALDTALKAVKDAGYEITDLPKETTGAVFGNTFMGEFTRSNMQRLRWPYVSKVLKASLKAKGLDHLFGEIEETMESVYKSVFAPVNEDTLAGGLPNTVAGRVCNFLNVNGGGYIVDGACSSSLLSIYSACNHLESRQMDVVIAGGVDISLDTFELIGFAKTKALAKKEMQVYDKYGNGFLPGEGCGVVILKRLEDAIRDKDQIYSVINGWGMSSDGAGGITAPSAKGQSQALKRAYKKGQVDPNLFDFIEGHGTGTTVGDKIELQGISFALGDEQITPLRKVGVTSLKSILGHTKAAAGIGALIKTSIALNQRVIPPTAGIEELNPIFYDKAKKIYPVLHGAKLDDKKIMQAGVSAMGFGGINCHIALQSGEINYEKLRPDMDVNKILASKQRSEVILFAEKSIEKLQKAISKAQIQSKGISYAELSDFAAQHNKAINTDNEFSAAVIARTPFDLADKLKLAQEKCLELRNNVNTITFKDNTIIVGKRKTDLKIGFLFPGQASQQLNSARILIERHEWAKGLANQADEIFSEVGTENVLETLFKDIEKAVDEELIKTWKKELTQTQMAQPAIILSSLLWSNYLQRLNINPTAVTGHSLGELGAFYAAGQFDTNEVLKFAASRGKVMAETGSGTMASLKCSVESADELIADFKGKVCIANINTPNQIIISGNDQSIDSVIEKAKEKSIAGSRINVSAAFHSHLMKDAATLISKMDVLQKEIKGNDIDLISCMTGDNIRNNSSIADYFSQQAEKGIDFIKTIENISGKTDVLIEVGPGRILSHLTSQINPDAICLPVEGTAENDIDFNVTIANLFVMGANINVNELYVNRFVRDFIPASEKTFIQNPLERPLIVDNQITAAPMIDSDLQSMLGDLGIATANASDYLQVRSGFIRDVIQTDMKYFNQSGTELPNTTLKSGSEKQKVSQTQLNASDSIAEQVKKYTLTEVENLTGFPKDHIKLESRLLDDYNLDSIKSGTLLVEILKEFDAVGKLEPVKYANASLQEIIDDVLGVLKEAGFDSSNNVSGQNIDQKVKDVIFSSVKEMTGFPDNAIKMESRLLDDYNLDSIKSGTLLVEVLKAFDLVGKLEPVKYSNASLQEIFDDVLDLVSKSGKTGQTESQEENLEQKIKNRLFSLVEEKTGFPIESITEEWKLLDDANLDSIKAGSLIADLSKEFNQTGNLEPIKYANASLLEIKNDLLALLEAKSPKTTSKANKSENQWVRSYVAGFEKANLNIEEEKVHSYWSDKSIGIFALTAQQSKAQNLVQEFSEFAREIKLIDDKSLQDVALSNLDALFVLAPNFDTLSIENFDAYVDYYQKIATSPILTYNSKIEIGFIEFGNAKFNRSKPGKDQGNINITNTVSFGSSIHLEKPGCKVRVFDIDSNYRFNKACFDILKDFVTPDSMDAVTLNKHGDRKRLINKLFTKDFGKSKLKFEKNEVIIITGGAKGITAECGIALAKEFKCKFAIIGSSPLKPEATVIHDNIARYLESAVDCKYYACDMANKDAVYATVAQIESEMGTVKGVLHGAGKNHPGRLDQLTHDGILDEISPKVLGALYFIDLFKEKPLKLLAGITSILGITGMRGNSSYCFSNETLDLLIRQYNQKHPQTLARTFAYSIWSEVGMGVKMGSIDALSHLGIGSIPPVNGVEEFMNGILYDTNDQQIAITSNVYGIDSWRRDVPHKPHGSRYLEDINLFEPGVELAVKAKLNIQKDCYLLDHNYNGSYLFPTVFGLEAMGQAVAFTLGLNKLDTVRLENINLSKPIVVTGTKDLEIEIKTLVSHPLEDEIKVRVGISTEHSNFKSNHFEATYCLENTQIDSTVKLNVPKNSLDIQPKTDLYGWLLFQGELFQHLHRIYKLSSKEALFSSVDKFGAYKKCFGQGIQNNFVLGNPLVRDTLLQSGQLLFTDKQYLPVGIKKWFINNSSYNLNGQELAVCKLKNIEGDTASCDVHAYDVDKNPVEFIEAYEVKSLRETPEYPTIEEIADITSLYNKKILDSIQQYSGQFDITGRQFSIGRHTNISNLVKDDRHILEQQIINNLFTDDKESVLLEWDTSGVPSLRINEEEKHNISISHTGDFMLFSTGKEKQACDIEIIAEKDIELWNALLNNNMFKIAEQLTDENESLDKSATRIWCLKEVIIKAAETTEIAVKSYYRVKEGIIFRVQVDSIIYHVLTFPANLMQRDEMMVAILVNAEEKGNAKLKHETMWNKIKA